MTGPRIGTPRLRAVDRANAQNETVETTLDRLRFEIAAAEIRLAELRTLRDLALVRGRGEMGPESTPRLTFRRLGDLAGVSSPYVVQLVRSERQERTGRRPTRSGAGE